MKARAADPCSDLGVLALTVEDDLALRRSPGSVDECLDSSEWRSAWNAVHARSSSVDAH